MGHTVWHTAWQAASLKLGKGNDPDSGFSMCCPSLPLAVVALENRSLLFPEKDRKGEGLRIAICDRKLRNF